MKFLLQDCQTFSRRLVVRRRLQRSGQAFQKNSVLVAAQYVGMTEAWNNEGEQAAGQTGTIERSRDRAWIYFICAGLTFE
ncbi:hypothetical protein XH99_01795 [Bradyrhizobium nanningense]|uniref:Uncharacterized protein n=1 Tax=Bradyrhizobium nanningense TaxID=1325118 RepID=A0A4V1L3H8_9BRAD|nr:hypothetical protein XH99_01795 [Bradyrhizobium nanningense]